MAADVGSIYNQSGQFAFAQQLLNTLAAGNNISLAQADGGAKIKINNAIADYVKSVSANFSAGDGSCAISFVAVVNGAEQTITVKLDSATESSAGLMNASQVQALQNLQAAVDSLQGGINNANFSVINIIENSYTSYDVSPNPILVLHSVNPKYPVTEGNVNIVVAADFAIVVNANNFDANMSLNGAWCGTVGAKCIAAISSNSVIELGATEVPKVFVGSHPRALIRDGVFRKDETLYCLSSGQLIRTETATDFSNSDIGRAYTFVKDTSEAGDFAIIGMFFVEPDNTLAFRVVKIWACEALTFTVIKTTSGRPVFAMTGLCSPGVNGGRFE